MTRFIMRRDKEEGGRQGDGTEMVRERKRGVAAAETVAVAAIACPL